MSWPCKHNHAMMLIMGNTNAGFIVKTFDDADEGTRFMMAHPLYRYVPKNNPHCFPTEAGKYKFKRGSYIKL